MFPSYGPFLLLSASLMAAVRIADSTGPLTPLVSLRGGLEDSAFYSPTTWTFPLETGGENMTFYGSLQDVEAQAQRIRPDFHFPTPAAYLGSPRQDDQTVIRCLDLDGDDGAVVGYIKAGIQYLRGLDNSVLCGNQPSGCGRISCSYSSAITWCNLADSYYTTPCNAFADYAQDVLDRCADGNLVHGIEWRLDGIDISTTVEHIIC